MAGEEKPLSDAVTVCSTSSWLVQTTVVPAGTVNVAGTMLKFSMLIDGPPDVSTGWAGLGGGSVASAAGGTGVDSPEAGEMVAAAVGAQPVSGRMPTSTSTPKAVRQPGRRWTLFACVDMEAELTSYAACWRLTAVHLTAVATSHLHRNAGTGLHRSLMSEIEVLTHPPGKVGVYCTVEVMACAKDDCAISLPKPGATGVAPSRGRLRAAGRSC